MRIIIIVLLLANIAAGLWGYLHAPPAPVIPPVRYAAHRPRPMPAPIGTSPKVPAPTPAAGTTAIPVCWQLGPLDSDQRATDLLRLLRSPGRVVRIAGATAAWRVYTVAPYPADGVLRALGIDGAYWTRGPHRRRVLSLGVFTDARAARRFQRRLAAHHLPTRRAALAAAPRYYDAVMMGVPPPRVWRRLGGIGHRRCRGAVAVAAGFP